MIPPVLERRRIASVPLRRDGGGKSELHRARCRVTFERGTRNGERGNISASRALSSALEGYTREVTPRGVPTESATENIPPGFARTLVRVKRWCKRPPREAQATRHGKPHRVQGQIGNRGAARSAFRESETGFGYRSLRQMILSVRKNEDRIRLTALPKPSSFLRVPLPGFPLHIENLQHSHPSHPQK